jgi:hypothetical protein
MLRRQTCLKKLEVQYTSKAECILLYGEAKDLRQVVMNWIKESSVEMANFIYFFNRSAQKLTYCFLFTYLDLRKQLML